MATYGLAVEFLFNGVKDEDGPLSGGKVYFYDPGTTDYKTIYTDRAKGTPASNFVTLDSDGRAEIFADGLYDIVVKKSDDTLFWDMDNVLFLDVSDITALAPASHKISHQNNGSDEISLAGLSGKSATEQDPTTHGVDHKGGGSDAIAVAVAGTTHGLFDKDDKTKLDAIEALAEANSYTKYGLQLSLEGNYYADATAYEQMNGYFNGIADDDVLCYVVVKIPTGMKKLSCTWQMWVHTGGFTGTIRAQVDGSGVGAEETNATTSPASKYQVDIDIDAYDDGGWHWLALYGKVAAGGTRVYARNVTFALHPDTIV